MESIEEAVIATKTMAGTGLSRRSFLGTAALAGVAALGVGTLAGCGQGTPAPAPPAGTEGSASSQSAQSQSTADNISPVAVPPTWDEEYDVIVVGTGGGLFGALRSAELGSKTLCIEKSASVGGASKESSIYAVSGTKVQLEAGLPDVTDMMIKSFISRQHQGAARTDLITKVATNAARAVDWLGVKGFEWEPTTTGGPTGGVTGVSPKGKEAGGLAARTNIYVFEFLKEEFGKAGGTLKLNTLLSALVKDGDRVVGIEVSDENNETKYFKAGKAVILAAGGMSANRDMLKKYIPSAYNRVKCSTTGTQDSGEAIRMGLGAGAAFTGYDAYQAFCGGLEGADWNYYLYNGDVQLARQAWLGIDITGKRFPYFTAVADYGKQARVLQCLPGATGYRFFDSHYEEYAAEQKQECCRYLINPSMPDVDRIPESLIEHDWREGAKRGIKEGRIKSADTLDELAELLGLDPGIVKKAVDDWNVLVAAGADEECGIPSQWLHPIKDAPFYGVAIGSIMFSTHAGLLTDVNFRVVSEKGTVIPGLYASGSTMGGCCGPDSDYGCSSNVSGGVCFTSTTAFLAAEHINGYKG
ncbi:MAG: FAD-binding protein [Coriobacteriaceae bacterium]|nr:FAD-binding protein [Coriobacteriaceae bacterium]